MLLQHHRLVAGKAQRPRDREADDTSTHHDGLYIC